jgi:hypothetical protein
MPYAPPTIVTILTPALISAGMIGQGVPKYSLGVATGVSNWLRAIKVTTIDGGTAGVGKGAPTPLIVPQPLLYANILRGMATNNLLGIMAPVFAVGLSTGLSTSFLQAFTSTTHPSVGTGAAVASFRAPPAYPHLERGFKAVGMVGDGPTKKARALGQALDTTFASLVLPVAIAGPPSPSPSSGSGTGNLI